MAKEKGLSRGWIALIVVIALLVIIGLWIASTYNKLITLDMNANNAWAQVQTQYQRRMDLIPNLVETVKGYAKHEEGVFTEITILRSQWQTATSNADIKTQMQVAAGMESALARLLVVVENYPELKANQNFLALQDELAGTENRIAVERKRFNDAIGAYNIKVKRFPSNIVAGMFGFEVRPFFEAEIGAEVAPKVEFD